MDPNQKWDKTRWVFEWKTTEIAMGSSRGISRGIYMAQKGVGAMFCKRTFH